MADILTKIDSSVINNSIESINKNTAMLSDDLKSIRDQAAYIMDVYKTNGKSTEALEKIVAEIDEINNNYLSNNQEFNNVMNSAVSAYSATDAQIQGQAMGLAGNDFSSGSGVVTHDGNLVEKPDSIPEGASLTADGRWSTVNADGKGTVYTNKGIEGTLVESSDVRVRALASGMDGGQVVKMADGRIAVRDRYGGGTIFNSDGSTESVAGRTIHAGKVEQISSSGNGADPFTQDLASEIVNSDLGTRNTNRLIKGYESQQEAEGTNSVLSVDAEALRNQINTIKDEPIDTSLQNYGPGFSDEHNAQVLASLASGNGQPSVSDVSTIAVPLVDNTTQVTEPVASVAPVANNVPEVPAPPIPEPSQPIGFEAPGSSS